MNKANKLMANDRVSWGAWIQIGHAAIAEIYAHLGFDWIAVDCEHSDIELESFTAIARAMGKKGPVPFARVRENDTLAIRQVLDCGAGGVIVPLVNTAQEAEKAVRAAKFPPQGERGFAFCRANNWGGDFDAYAKSANHAVAVIIMIETKTAVENIEEILQVEGVDGLFIGPYDLSGSYGVVGQTQHENVVLARKKVVGACKKYGKLAGLHDVCPSEASIKGAVAEGFTFLALGTDGYFLNEKAGAALKIARSTIEEKTR